MFVLTYFLQLSFICVCVCVCLFFRYVSADDKRRSGVKVQNEMTIQRKRKHPSNLSQTVSVPYKVVSNPLRLQSDEW